MVQIGSTPAIRSRVAHVVLLGCICASIGAQQALAQQPTQSEVARAGWSIPFAGGWSSPIVTGDTLYVGASDGVLYAIDPSNGSIRWRFETGAGLTSGPRVVQVPPGSSLGDMVAAARALPARGRREISATPVVEAGTVYIGSLDHSFYAIDARSGQMKWSYATGGDIGDRALIHGSVIVVVSDDGLIHGLDRETGEKRWTADTVPSRTYGKRKPKVSVVLDGTVYATNWPVHGVGTSSASFIHAIESASGRFRWTLEVEGDFPSPPTHADGLVIFSSEERKTQTATTVTFHALDATSGAARWRYETEATPYTLGRSKAQIQAADCVVAVTDRVVAALETKTGAVRWTRRSDPGGEFDSALVQGNMVLVGTRRGELLSAGRARGELLALDISTGAQKWATRLGSMFSGIDGRIEVAAVRGDSVYVVAGRSLQRFQLATGKEAWSHSSDTRILAAPFVDDSHVYVASEPATSRSQAPDRGQLQALDIRSGKVRP